MSTPLAVHRAAPGIVLLARAGFAAKGIVYVVIGALAARAAFGSGGETTDQRGALRAIAEGPFGKLALLIIGVGLLGYMAWRLAAAATDAEGEGDDPTSVAKRLGQAARGLAYGALGVAAIRLLAGRGERGGDQTESWTARLLGMPFGRALVIAAGLGVFTYAGWQLYKASQPDRVRRHLDLARAGHATAEWVVRLGRFGIAARGVVIALVGLFLVRAATQHDSSEAGGLEQSLDALASAPYGTYVLAIVALGLMAYGGYQLATARYRRIRAVPGAAH